METHGLLRWMRPAALGVLLVAAMAVGALIATRATGDRPASTATAASSAEARGGRQLPVSNAAIGNLPDLVDRVKPSVVAINTVVTNRTGQRQGQGLGTGIVVDKQGNILTNYHVVDGANQVSVKFADGTMVGGRVIGSDPGNDLAVVHVDVPANLPPGTHTLVLRGQSAAPAPKGGNNAPVRFPASYAVAPITVTVEGAPKKK